MFFFFFASKHMHTHFVQYLRFILKYNCFVQITLFSRFAPIYNPNIPKQQTRATTKELNITQMIIPNKYTN